MDFRRLRYFVAIAESGNFHRAAERLHIAQPCLTRHINKLEAELGTLLLERLPRGVRPTPFGATFLEDAKRILGDVRRLRDRARAAGLDPGGCLNAGFDDTVAQNITLARACQQMRARFPQVKLALVPASETELLQRLKAGEIDAAFAYDICGEFATHPGIACYTVQRDDMVAVLRADDPLARRDEILLADLVGKPVVMISKDKAPKIGYQYLLDVCRAGGLELDIVQEVESIDALLSLVSVGVGVSLIARHVRDVLSNGLVLRPVKDLNIKLDLSLMWRRTSASPNNTEKFVDIVKNIPSAPPHLQLVG
jgi:DNA-binding transcriptional LysR family regulator